LDGTDKRVDSKLTTKQLRILKETVATWDGIPPVDKFIESDMTKEGKVVTFKFKYMTDDNKQCTVDYSLTIDKEKGVLKKHKFECIQLPEEDFDR
ncbi:hypothetical protein GE061_017198, partial [Apolygus lucorum]